MKIKIIGAKTNNFDSIFLLLKELWPKKRLNKKKLKSVFTRELHNSTRAFLVAITEDKIVGFVSLSIKNSFYDAGSLGHVDELVVDEDYRGRGIGKTLLEEIIKIAKKKHCGRVELDSAFHRKAAHKFYIAQGFEKCNFLFSKNI